MFHSQISCLLVVVYLQLIEGKGDPPTADVCRRLGGGGDVRGNYGRDSMLKEMLRQIQCKHILGQINDSSQTKALPVSRPKGVNQNLKLYLKNLIKLKNGEIDLKEMLRVAVPCQQQGQLETGPGKSDEESFTRRFFTTRVLSDNLAPRIISSTWNGRTESIKFAVNKHSSEYRSGDELVAAELVVASEGNSAAVETLEVQSHVGWKSETAIYNFQHEYGGGSRHQLRHQQLALLDLNVDAIGRWYHDTATEEDGGNITFNVTMTSLRQRDQHYGDQEHQRHQDIHRGVYGLVLSFRRDPSEEPPVMDDLMAGPTRRKRDIVNRSPSESALPCHLKSFKFYSGFIKGLSISCEGDDCLWEIGQCVGVCEYPISTSVDVSNHALINNQLNYLGFHTPPPCCVPSLYKTKYYMKDNEDEVAVGHWDNVVVTKCGCR